MEFGGHELSRPSLPAETDTKIFDRISRFLKTLGTSLSKKELKFKLSINNKKGISCVFVKDN